MADRHQLVQTRTYTDGLTYRHATTGARSAADAQRERQRRLRDAGVPYRSGPGWCEYHDQRHVEPSMARLEWTDTERTDR